MPAPLANYLRWIETEIHQHQFGKTPASLYEPIRYLMGLGGKRMRPLLVLLAYSLFRKDVRRIAKYAMAVEAFHNFTLMHDDIMDKAPLRRGKPTVHIKWNINTAILSGDVMLVKVYKIFADLEPKKLQEVLTAFNQCAAEVCEGQQWDMEFEQRATVSEDEYINMIRLKTAVLLGFSLELGAILAGASKKDRKALRDFGILIGIGFQLTDDLLDAYADPRKFGKQVGGDIVSNKKTFLLIKALETARGNDKNELTRWLSSRARRNKVKAVKAVYDRLEIARLTENKITHFFNKGFRSLERLSIAKDKKRTLENYTRSLIERQS